MLTYHDGNRIDSNLFDSRVYNSNVKQQTGGKQSELDLSDP